MMRRMEVPCVAKHDSQAVQPRSSTSSVDSGCILCDAQLQRDELDEPMPETVEPSPLSIKEASDLLYDTIEDYQTRLLLLEPGRFGAPLKARLHTGYIVHQPGLVIHEWKQRVQYTALSYTWGSQEFPHSILINNVKMPITSNLFAFLQRYRDKVECRHLWIDALCINQSDAVEKTMQVKNMMRIYKKAELVIVWLGDQGKKTNFAMRALSNTKLLEPSSEESSLEQSSSEDAYPSLCMTCVDALVAGIEDIGNRDWARRIWIKQEIYAAKQSIVCCGSRQLEWETYRSLESIVTRVLSRFGRHAAPMQKQQDFLRNLRNLNKRVSWREFLDELRRGTVFGSEFTDKAHISAKQDFSGALSCLLLQSNGCQSTLAQDRIYALVGIAEAISKLGKESHNKHSYTFEIDYRKTVQEVFMDFAWLVISTLGSIWVLKRIEPTHDELELPSWVPDYRDPPPPPESSALYQWYQNGPGYEEIYRVGPSFLCIKGVRFATVSDEALGGSKLVSDPVINGQILVDPTLLTHLRSASRWRFNEYQPPEVSASGQLMNSPKGDRPCEEARLPAHSEPGDWVVNMNATLSIVIRKESKNLDRFKFIGSVRPRHYSIIWLGYKQTGQWLSEEWRPLIEEFCIV